jgi:hypothetical protein
MAAQMIRAFAAPAGLKVRVLFDAFYLCPTTVRACQDKAFCFFSVAARNRNFTTGQGKRRRRRQIAAWMPGVLRHQGRNVRLRRSRNKRASLRIACRDGNLSKVGPVRMVFSKRPAGPWKRCIAIVTNETGLRPRQIVEIYERRWGIEVLFKELLQDLGLGDYQMLQKDGIVKHLHACCLAHQMLTHRSIKELGEKACKPKQQVSMPPMSSRLSTLRREIAEDQIHRIVKGKHHAKLRKKLCTYLLGQPPPGKIAA